MYFVAWSGDISLARRMTLHIVRRLVANSDRSTFDNPRSLLNEFLGDP